MKALQITSYGKIEKSVAILEINKPRPRENEVLVEVYSSSVNPIDYKIILGALKVVNKLKFPAPIGFDVSGIVTQIGAGVKKFKVGDEVFSRVPTDKPGTFAQFICIDEKVVVKKPTNVNFDDAASIPLVGLTTYQAYELANLKNGDTILIHAGSGGIGTFAIQYAKVIGAYVYTTTSTKNVEWVKALGADIVIDYNKENYLDIVNDIDCVYDTLGGKFTTDAFQIIKNGGKVISIAGDLDEQTINEFGLNSILRLLLNLKRLKIDKLAKKKAALYRFIMMKPNAKQLEDIAQMMSNHTVKAVIDKVFPFENSIDALLYQKSGRAKGKIIIKLK